MSLAGPEWENVLLTVDTAVSFHPIMKMLGCYLAPSNLCWSVTVLLIPLLWISIHKHCDQMKRCQSPRDRQEEASRSSGPASLFPPAACPNPFYICTKSDFHFLRKKWELDMCGLVSWSVRLILKFNSGTWKSRVFDLWTVRTSVYVGNAGILRYIPARPKGQTMCLTTSRRLLIEESS